MEALAALPAYLELRVAQCLLRQTRFLALDHELLGLPESVAHSQVVCLAAEAVAVVDLLLLR